MSGPARNSKELALKFSRWANHLLNSAQVDSIGTKRNSNIVIQEKHFQNAYIFASRSYEDRIRCSFTSGSVGVIQKNDQPRSEPVAQTAAASQRQGREEEQKQEQAHRSEIKQTAVTHTLWFTIAFGIGIVVAAAVIRSKTLN